MCVYVYIYIYIYIFVYVYIYIYIHIYIYNKHLVRPEVEGPGSGVVRQVPAGVLEEASYTNR